jgi:hypothetical protein
MARDPLFVQPNRSFDFGKKKPFYQYTAFSTHSSPHSNGEYLLIIRISKKKMDNPLMGTTFPASRTNIFLTCN